MCALCRLSQIYLSKPNKEHQQKNISNPFKARDE